MSYDPSVSVDTEVYLSEFDADEVLQYVIEESLIQDAATVCDLFCGLDPIERDRALAMILAEEQIRTPPVAGTR